MSIYTDIANQLSFLIDDTGLALGVTATYYPAVLTGYDETVTARDPSEESSVAIKGLFTNLTQSSGEAIVSRGATFTFPYSVDLGFQPTAMDRLVIGAYSYRTTSVTVTQIGATVSSYTLTLEQA